MPARKEPRRIIDASGQVWLKPGPGERGGIPVILDLETAKTGAEWEANRYDQYRYVVAFNDGYVVMGYADLWDYFGDDMKDEIVYKVDAPGISMGKKWPGEH